MGGLATAAQQATEAAALAQKAVSATLQYSAIAPGLPLVLCQPTDSCRLECREEEIVGLWDRRTCVEYCV
eukprot:COSAG02_NODE_591_length_19862_cov_8.047918_14_plen_70_part_00